MGELWPLVGRDDLLAQIVSAEAERAVSGVVLVGASGVGRTRLAREACARLTRDGSHVAWVTATRAAASVAFGALPHLIPRSPGGELDVLRHFAERFGATDERRAVLAVDDAHLLDSASVALIHHLAVQGRGFLVVTVQSGAPVPDALLALWKEQMARRIEVPALAFEHVDALLADGSFDAISRGRLRDLCAGNPLVLRELVNAGRESGTLQPIDGLQHWTRGRDYVTDRLADVVEGQSGVSDPRIAAALEVLACADPLDQVLVERLVDDASMIEAERRQLVVFGLSGSRLEARLTVPAYGEVIRARMPSSRRREIYRRLAAALAAFPMRRADDILRLAWWRLQGGLPVTPADLLAAARRAASRLDFEVAEQLAIAARKAGTCPRADLVLAEVLIARGRHAEAASVLPRAVNGWEPRDLARLAIVRARVRYWDPPASNGSGRAVVSAAPNGSGRDAVGGTASNGSEPAHGAAAGATPNGSGPGKPARDAVVLAARAWCDLLDGDVRSVWARGDAVPTLPPAAAVWVSTAAMIAGGLLGRVDSIERTARAAMTIVNGHARGLPFGAAPVDGARCAATMLAGSLGAAAVLADDGYRAAMDARAEPLVAVWAGLSGIVARAQGRVDTALVALRESIVLLDRFDALRFGRVYLAELAGAYGMAGNPHQARIWLARADRYEPPPGVLMNAWVEVNRAWVAAADLDMPRAAGHALTAAGMARATEQPMVEALALLDAARLGAAADAAGRLSLLAEETGVEKISVFADAAIALGTGDARRLDVAAEGLRRLGYLLAAAEVATTAYRTHARAGRRSSGYAALALAREMLRECGDVRTPLLDLTGVHTDLTTRELQVARMAADGFSAQAIADRLGVSRRTVNNHLGHVYAKLGLTGRQDLADLLAPAGP